MEELGERLATEQNEKWKQETRRRERQKKKRERAETGREKSFGRGGVD